MQCFKQERVTSRGIPASQTIESLHPVDQFSRCRHLAAINRYSRVSDKVLEKSAVDHRGKVRVGMRIQSSIRIVDSRNQDALDAFTGFFDGFCIESARLHSLCILASTREVMLIL